MRPFIEKFRAIIITISRSNVVRKVLGAMSAQLLLSLSSFALGLSLARFAEKEEYGIYVVLFSVIGIFKNMQNALVNTPMTVIMQKADQKSSRKIISGTAWLQILVLVPCALLSMIILLSLFAMNNERIIYSRIALLSVAVLFFLSKEFIRSVNFMRLEIRYVFIMDICYAILLFSLVGVFLLAGILTSTTAILALSIGYFASAVIGFTFLKDGFLFRKGNVRWAAKQNWQYGRWAFVGAISSTFQNRAYIFVATAILGLEQIADISAARLLLMPIGVFIASSVKIIIAKGSDLVGRSSTTEFRKFIFFIMGFLMLASLCYLVFLILAYKHIVAILGPKYANIQKLAFLWGGYFLVTAIRMPLEYSLLVLKKFRIVAINDIVAGVSTLVLCFFFTRAFSTYGAVASLLGGESILLTLLLVQFVRTENLMRTPRA